MALPKITLPQYELTLPSDGSVIKYRPFIMREEKLLMMALEDGREVALLDAVHNIVSECTNGSVNSLKSPLFDVQYAFLQIRAKSVAEMSDFVVHCGACDAKVPTEIDLTKIGVERVDGHERKIALSDNLGVIMKYPTILHLTALTQSVVDPKAIYEVIADCIETVYTPDEVTVAANEPRNELLAFIDGLPVSQFNKIQKFFATMPVLRHEHKFPCPKCGRENILKLEGIESFFV